MIVGDMRQGRSNREDRLADRQRDRMTAEHTSRYRGNHAGRHAHMAVVQSGNTEHPPTLLSNVCMFP